MRKLVKNGRDTFRVKAYAGTRSALLAFDVDPALRPGFLGFAVEQNESKRGWQWLLSSLTFPGVAHTLPKWGATPSNLAPFQKFRWADYSIEPGASCRYRVHLAYSDPQKPMVPKLGESLEVEIRTDDGKPTGHRVSFNRAVAASQAFGRKFPELVERLSEEKDLPVEEWPKKASAWLENGLLNAILDFIRRAKNANWALDVAIYEYELGDIVRAVDDAFGRGVDVRVLYHAKPGDPQTTANKASLKGIPAACKRGRVPSKIFHDKFIVLNELDTSGARRPVAVLCGSTNFTENGVYRQANVVHVVDDLDLASCYAELFEVLWDSPKDVSAARKWINTNNPIDEAKELFAGFSPRSSKKDLQEFLRIIKSADTDLLFATAFKLPEDILDALLGAPHDPILRFGIQNSSSRITGYHADRTAEFTTPALLSKGLEGWVREGLRGQKGSLLVHLKVIVTDFTTDHPVVISGSHNLSASASSSNDENYLIMRKDTDLADRYGLEVLRFYEHYRFRYYAKQLDLQQARPLETDERWTIDYYVHDHLKERARLRFSGR